MARVPGTQRGCSGASQVSGCHLVTVDASRSHWCPAKCITPKRKEGRKEGRFEPGTRTRRAPASTTNPGVRRVTHPARDSLAISNEKSNVPSFATSCEPPLPSSVSTTDDDVRNHEALEPSLSLSCFPDPIFSNIRVHRFAPPGIKLRRWSHKDLNI